MTDTYAIVGKLKLQEIEGAKTLQMGWFGGLPYAVSKDFTEDELVLIFLPDGQISEEFANEHDLITRHDPETGKKVNNGYLGKNRKVRSIKLMGGKIRSVGVVMKLDSLAFTGYNIHDLKEGDSFNELNGVPICKKYVNPNTRRNQGKSSTNHKQEERGLKMFDRVNQFYKFGNTLEKGDLITTTLKLDGTSVRIGNSYVERKLSLWEKFAKMFGASIQTIENKQLTATRRVIIERTDGQGYYGDHGLYLEVGEKLEGMLSPGESIYGEIVGWIDKERPLFNRGGTIMKYGVPAGERDFYVYDITWTLPNGEMVHLPWNKIKARCNELGLKHVPEMKPEWNYLHNIESDDHYYIDLFYKPQMVYDGILDHLEKQVYSFVEGDDPLDPSHIREGVVLRVERANGETEFFKAKSTSFYELEDAFKSNDDNADIEESQDTEDC